MLQIVILVVLGSFPRCICCKIILQSSAKQAEASGSSPTETAVRVGDVYALLIEHHAGKGAFPAAHALLERMQAGNIRLGPFIDAGIVEQVYKVCFVLL